MNVFDFDKTLYRRDCTVDFYLHCLRRYPRMLRRLPALIWAGLLFGGKRIDKTAFKQRFFAFLRDIPDTSAEVACFWDEHIRDIHAWYPPMQREDDLVISASPEFLVRPACQRIGIRYVIGSPVDPKTGRYSGPNCHGKQKVAALRAAWPDAVIENFYSDSHSDDPLAALAQKAYIVKGESLFPW